MGSREELHYELLTLVPNAYFQPPATLKMKYPCIVYHKTPNYKEFANGGVYRRVRAYTLTLIETDPDSECADKVEDTFNHCTITNHYVSDNLHHTTLNLYY